MTDAQIDAATQVLSLNEAAANPQVRAFFPSLSALHWAAKQRKRNGLADSGAVIKVAGRMKVVVPRLVSWGLNQH